MTDILKGQVATSLPTSPLLAPPAAELLGTTSEVALQAPSTDPGSSLGRPLSHWGVWPSASCFPSFTSFLCEMG